jgi:APA family basic amino acid/polyamine antiporter
VLTRQLGLADAVVLGMGAMLGAGVFVAFGPATAAAGRAVPLALLLAAAVAWANADSSARLAATLPRSGGIYAYGRERLTPFWGGLAGFAFLIGKTASAGAIAGTAASHLLPRHATAAAIGAVVALTTLAAAGIRRGALATRVVVALVVGVLGAVVASAAGPAVSGLRTLPEGGGPAGAAGALAGAGILFFAFAGYARITTLGEEVRDPERTIPRAITLSLALVLVIYAAVGAALLGVLGTARLAASESPLADLASSVGGGGWGVAIGVTAGIAALASGLGVLLGLSRTTFAMARDGGLARLDGRPADPRPVRAQVVAGLATILGIVLLDLRQAIVVSSIAVLLYYAIGHLAALTLPGGARRVVPVAGLVGCIAVAVALAAGIPGT